jgi:hypothetical protein
LMVVLHMRGAAAAAYEPRQSTCEMHASPYPGRLYAHVDAVEPVDADVHHLQPRVAEPARHPELAFRADHGRFPASRPADRVQEQDGAVAGLAGRLGAPRRSATAKAARTAVVPRRATGLG